MYNLINALAAPKVKAVFCDYHGVLTGLSQRAVRHPPGISNVKREALTALRLLKQYRLYIVSNQPGVAFGDFSEFQLVRAINGFVESLRDQGIVLSGFFYCPHHPNGRMPGYSLACTCRKPNPLLLDRALSANRILKSDAVFVGDTLETDIACANAAGIKSIWISKNHKSADPTRQLRPTWLEASLKDAVPRIHECLTVNQTEPA